MYEIYLWNNQAVLGATGMDGLIIQTDDEFLIMITAFN